MAAEQAQGTGVAVEEFRGPARRVGVRQPVEPVTLQASPGPPFFWQRVRAQQLRRAVGPQPLLERTQVRGVTAHVADGDLVRAERALDLDAVHRLRPGPAFRRAQHDHRPLTCARPLPTVRSTDADPVSRQRREEMSGRSGMALGSRARVIPCARSSGRRGKRHCETCR